MATILKKMVKVAKTWVWKTREPPNSYEISPRLILSSSTSSNEGVLPNNKYFRNALKNHEVRVKVLLKTRLGKKTPYNSHEMLKTFSTPSPYLSVYQLKCQSPSSTSCAAMSLNSLFAVSLVLLLGLTLGANTSASGLSL